MKYIILARDFRGAYLPLCAQRDVPAEPNDSGWQVWAEGEESCTDKAQVWGIEEFCKEYPSFEQFVDLQPGTELKCSENGIWKP